MRRIIQLRPDISVGWHAIGTKASMKSGYRMPQSHACMPPIELPITSLRWRIAESLGDEPVLREHHVVVVVARELRAQAVGRLRGVAGADRVGKDEEVLRRVERLPRAEQLAREWRRQHADSRPGRAVQDEHRLAGRRTNGRVVDSQRRNHLAGVKAKVGRSPVRFLRCRKVGGQRERRADQCDSEKARHAKAEA
jgi:hypothetical protein